MSTGTAAVFVHTGSEGKEKRMRDAYSNSDQIRNVPFASVAAALPKTTASGMPFPPDTWQWLQIEQVWYRLDEAGVPQKTSIKARAYQQPPCFLAVPPFPPIGGVGCWLNGLNFLAESAKSRRWYARLRRALGLRANEHLAAALQLRPLLVGKYQELALAGGDKIMVWDFMSPVEYARQHPAYAESAEALAIVNDMSDFDLTDISDHRLYDEEFLRTRLQDRYVEARKQAGKPGEDEVPF